MWAHQQQMSVISPHSYSTSIRAYTTTGYPTAWTNFTVTLSNITAPVEGRLAFRYFVENGGPNGVNSDYIGIDTVQYGCNGSLVTPTPGQSPTASPTATPTSDRNAAYTSTPPLRSTPTGQSADATTSSTPPCDIWTPINTTPVHRLHGPGTV